MYLTKSIYLMNQICYLNKQNNELDRMKISRNSPPQQKEAAPIDKTPLCFKASITGFASSKASFY